MHSAPLIAGNDLRDMTPVIHDILTNREVIAIDQDRGDKQATRVSKSGDQEIWVKQLAGGGQAVAVFNRSYKEANVSGKWAPIRVKKTHNHLDDPLAHKEQQLDN